MDDFVIHQTVEQLNDAMYKAAAKALQTQNNKPEFCTTKDACAILGNIHRNTLRTYRMAGDIVGYKVGKRMLYKRAELLQFIESGKIG